MQPQKYIAPEQSLSFDSGCIEAAPHTKHRRAQLTTVSSQWQGREVRWKTIDPSHGRLIQSKSSRIKQRQSLL